MFKIGDKVKCIEDCYSKVKKGQIVEVIGVRGNDIALKGIYDEEFCYEAKDFELIVEETNMKKEDIKNLDIVTLRNGDKLILINNKFKDMSSNNNNTVTDISDFTDELKYDYNDRTGGKNDIVKIERFNNLDTNIVYSREEVKEITLADIEDKFGCKVKIVKEK